MPELWEKTWGIVMRKSTKRLLAILCIIFVLGSAAAFLIVKNRTPRFWISYCSAVAALAAVGFGAWKTPAGRSQPPVYLFETVSGIYAAAVAAAIYIGHVRLHLPARWYAALHILLLAVYLVLMIVGASGRQYIADQDKAVRQQVMKARMDVERVAQLTAAADDLPPAVKSEAADLLREVEDKLRFSDPMQSAETAGQAGEVDKALDELETAMDDLQAGKADMELLRQKAKAAVRKIDAYNRAKKCLK